MDDNKQEEIQEGSLVEDGLETNNNQSADAIVITNLQELINSTLNKIMTIGEEVKPLDEMISSVLENDETWQGKNCQHCQWKL